MGRRVDSEVEIVLEVLHLSRLPGLDPRLDFIGSLHGRLMDAIDQAVDRGSTDGYRTHEAESEADIGSDGVIVRVFLFVHFSFKFNQY